MASSEENDLKPYTNSSSGLRPRAVNALTHSAQWFFSKAHDYVYFNPRFNAHTTTTPITLYCVHGTADYPGSLRPLAHRLLDTNLPSTIEKIVLLNFSHRFKGKSVEFFAQELKQHIAQNHVQRVILIGHSRGGLINAYFAEFLAHDVQIDALINYAAPFQGSKKARFPLTFFSNSVQEMRLSSEFLEALKQKISHSMYAYYFIAGPNDTLVANEHAIVPEYVEQHPHSSLILSEPHGHLSMLESDEAMVFIHEILVQFEAFEPDLSRLRKM